MKDQETITPPERPASGRRSRFRWYHLYYLLAAFDLITISTSLYLGHRILNIYTESVATDRVWAERLVRISQLAERLTDVNAPGNNVFESLDVQAEAARLDRAVSAYHDFVREVRRDVRLNVHSGDSHQILGRLERLDAAVVSIEAEARKIFHFVSTGRTDLAGQHMSTMDQYFAQTAPQIRRLVECVGSIQGEHFDEEMTKARQLGRFELMIAGWIVPILGGVIFYGHSLAKRMSDSEAGLNRFRAALDISADALFLIDREKMRFLDINQTACVSLGYSRDELLTMGPRDVKPESETALRERFERVIASQNQTGCFETVHRRKDGSTFPVEVVLRPLKTGQQTILVSSVRDISERKQTEAELETLNRQLVDTAREAGKSEIATSVLHNVGNVLNSVNVSAGLAEQKVRSLDVPSLNKAIDLMQQHLDDLETYVTRDERGRHLPRFLVDVGQQMAVDQKEILGEIGSLVSNVNHIKSIVAAQQSYATGVSGVVESVSLSDVLEDAIRINAASIQRHSIEINRAFDDVAAVRTDRQKLLQILVNLIGNAKNACNDSHNEVKQITVALRRSSEDRVAVEVSDNGVGIAQENITRIFSYGFTTRKQGHGFGLHSAALTAEELGGCLTARSDGRGTGATFALELPYQEAGVVPCLS